MFFSKNLHDCCDVIYVPVNLLSYFEKIAHMSVVWAYVSLWLCNFVTLYVRMFVARANKVEGTMSWCLGTNEILASI